MPPQQFSCGIDFINVRDLSASLTAATETSYNFACFPIVHPRYRRDYVVGKPTKCAFTRTDMLLQPADWNVRVVGKLSPYLDVDCKVPGIRQHHEDLMVEEMNYCKGLGLPAMMLRLKGPNNNNLARIVNSMYNTSPTSINVWIQVPMEDPAVVARQRLQSANEKVAILTPDTRNTSSLYEGTWQWWSDFHKLTEWERRIGLALILCADLPEEGVLTRWLGEPVRCILLPTHVFICNKKGYPVLPKAHKEFIMRLMDRDVQLVVTGACRHNEMTHYLQYLKFLWNSRTPTRDPMIEFAKGWEDYLQTPLQPLSDNLDSHTYNVFEKDPIKYINYQNAIVAALQHRMKNTNPCKGGIINSFTVINSNHRANGDKTRGSIGEVNNAGDHASNLTSSGINSISIPAEAAKEWTKSLDPQVISGVCPSPDDKGMCTCQFVAVVMVVGAGRGPLVRATLNAGKITGIELKVYAVEKNPTALMALYAQKEEIWQDSVTVVASDMRDFKPDQLADIIVSEMLGSFGDNELSPECLDGARHLLKPDGISIPESYTSHVCPVMSARLWSHVRAGEKEDKQKPPGHCFETLWVVYLQNKYDIAPPKPLFTFEHPSPPGPVDRRRFESLQFPVERGATLHGFSGYFTCNLFGEHTVSIHPDSHSEGMISWFPVFVPIKSPISLKAGEMIEANFWRCVGPRKVWYEWNITSPEVQAVHNSGGKSSDMIL